MGRPHSTGRLTPDDVINAALANRVAQQGHDSSGQGKTEEAADKFLAHYGIKGMKWGVRRRRGADGLVEKSQDVQNAEAARAKIGKKGDTSALSNKELQSLVTRMNLDQQYSRLAGEEVKAKKSSGKRVVQNILATGKTVNDVIAFVNSPAGKMVKDLLKKK